MTLNLRQSLTGKSIVEAARAAICVVFAASLIGGCAATGNGDAATAALGGSKSPLTLQQIDAVTLAARQMVNDPSAVVHGLKSRPTADGGGLDVCGYVNTARQTSTPLYVELRDTAGAISAERGQIGGTPANLAKVLFMCRAHDD